MYLLLKAEHAEPESNGDSALIQSHPIMLHLQRLNALIQNLEDGVETKAPGLCEQLENLIKAAALMGAPLDGALDDDDIDDKLGNSGDEGADSIDATQRKDLVETIELGSRNDDADAVDSEEADGSSDDEDESASRRATVLTEARFGLRPSEIANEKKTRTKRSRLVISDAGDDDMDDSQQRTISQSLATTLNSIEQRSGTRMRRTAPPAEHVDDDDDDSKFRRGLATDEADAEGLNDPELDGDDDDNGAGDFYSQVSKQSKARKEQRKDFYSVAPKFPRVEGVIDGERALSNVILKNRGLVAHKAKINRNPRVKKREQYRKAIIRRKGAVRDVRTDEGHKYGGEATGIKSGLSRSRKLAR